MVEEMGVEMANKRVEELEKQMGEVMMRMGIKEKGENVKKEKGENVKKEDNKKRGMTGYLLFAKEKRNSVKDELVKNGSENPKPTEVITEVAKRWKSMSTEEQGEWNERAKTVRDDE